MVRSASTSLRVPTHDSPHLTHFPSHRGNASSEACVLQSTPTPVPPYTRNLSFNLPQCVAPTLWRCGTAAPQSAGPQAPLGTFPGQPNAIPSCDHVLQVARNDWSESSAISLCRFPRLSAVRICSCSSLYAYLFNAVVDKRKALVEISDSNEKPNSRRCPCTILCQKYMIVLRVSWRSPR